MRKWWKRLRWFLSLERMMRDIARLPYQGQPLMYDPKRGGLYVVPRRTLRARITR